MTRRGIDAISAEWAWRRGREAPKSVPPEKSCFFRWETEHAKWWRAGWSGEPFRYEAQP